MNRSSSKKQKYNYKCCLCKRKVNGTDKYGHNPQPLSSKGRCCDACNYRKVIPARLNKMSFNPEVNKILIHIVH